MRERSTDSPKNQYVITPYVETLTRFPLQTQQPRAVVCSRPNSFLPRYYTTSYLSD